MSQLGWDKGVYRAEDGREFAIASEQNPGEPRFYWPMLRQPSADWFGDFEELPDDWSWSSTDKRVIRRRIERYVRATSDPARPAHEGKGKEDKTVPSGAANRKETR